MEVKRPISVISAFPKNVLTKKKLNLEFENCQLAVDLCAVLVYWLLSGTGSRGTGTSGHFV